MFTYDHENRLTQSVVGGVTSSSVYNGDGLRMSHTEGVVTTTYTWDVAAGLPVVVQDSDNTYVYGLDLISTTDGAGVQTYHLYDGLGSTTDLTDGSANPTDAYSYDVFGTIRSQSGSSPNYWLFTGEQRDGQPGTPGGLQRLPLDQVVSSTNLTGATVANLDDDPDAPDANWATATTVADTSLRVGFPTPPDNPTPGPALQEFRVLLRKNASGGNNPTYDIELWETGGGAPLATLVSGATLSSDTGQVVSARWDASLLGTADGSAVEVRVVGHRSGGSPNSRRTVEVGAIEWNAAFQGTPSSELYYLRARYYDPETGRFLGRDPISSGNLYAYVGNNPLTYVDPYGLFGCGPFSSVCDKFGDAGECVLNALDCVDPRQAADPLINLLPEGDFQIFGTRISYQLTATCLQYPEACAAAAGAAAKAQAITALLYSPAQRQEGTSGRPKEGDAFQHCFWSGLTTLSVGAGRAEKVTTRYEAVAGNDPDQRDYDIHNNKRGREFAQYLRASPNPWSGLAQEAALLGYCQ